ncbi:MAG: hypothetical protein J6A29_00280, partial [Clostridia bacterium]|nr:hypothetical protein [Clostridia bacterium]
MKTLKNNKTKTLLVALIILIFGIMIVFVCSKSSKMAAESISCANCGATMYLSKSSTGHTYSCLDCSYSFSNAHTFGYWSSTGSEKHSKTCSVCGYAIAEAHTGGTHSNDGSCTTCGQVYQRHSQSSAPKGYIKTSTTHTPSYACTYDGCTETYNGTSEKHTFGYWSSTDSEQHSKTCSVCGYATTEAHTGGTHSNDGTCTTCGGVYQNHSQSTTAKGYIKTSTTHTPSYACTCDGCTETYNGTSENHAFGALTSSDQEQHSKTCSVCGYAITEAHDFSIETWTPQPNGRHILCKTCSYCGCVKDPKDDESGGDCSGGTHENGGKCTTCGGVYQDHDSSIETWIPQPNAKHVLCKTCSYCGYVEDPKNNEPGGDCSGGTHGNGGKCTVCGGVYQTHQMQASGYVSEGNGSHRRQLTCSYSGCEETALAETSACGGGTHENEGKCTTCGGVYQKHELSWSEYEYIGNAHHEAKGICT